MKRLVFLILLTGMFVFTNAQNSSIAKYWIQFKNKEGTPYSTAQPEAFLSPKAIEKRKAFHIPVTEQDFPVNKSYIDSLQRFDTTMRVLSQSKWFNGITVYSEHPDLLSALKPVSFVADCEVTIPLKEREQIVENINRIYEVIFTPTDDELNSNDLPMNTLSYYGRSWNQFALNNAQWLPRMGYTGKGVTLMVMDAGFQGVNTIRQFACLRNSKRLLGARNFVQPSVSPYARGSHGTMVLSCIASLLPDSLIGTAPGISVWLAQTEDGRSEHKIEEDNWVAGIEWADSLGCDMLNSSLGYTQFDDKKPHRAHADLTGRASRASQAATIATEKGMIVCNSMGNEGANKWRYICIPADAHDILSVGAATGEGRMAAFSSQGPTADGRTKPDACALGLNAAVANPRGEVTIASGTSFAAPLLCGMVACLKEAFPHHPNYAIMNAVRQSGSHYASPTPGYGYGIADMLKAYNILNNPVLNNPETQFCTVNFENYATSSSKIRVTFEPRSPMKLTVKQQLRGSSKEHVKTYNVKGSKTVTLKTPPLNRNKKWGLVDITISSASLRNMEDMNPER
ncbi:MAG: S8 family serine peptidase, partial [Bacteroidales bacterium]|nr:S8 family serine peptidase [Bacteroidales bacterium]